MNPIRMHRERLGMTQQKLADIMGVTRTTVTMWELGLNMPTLRTLIKLAEVFGIKASDLVDEFERKEVAK